MSIRLWGLVVALLCPLAGTAANGGSHLRMDEAFFPFGEKPIRVVVYRLSDQTDRHDELVQKDEWLIGQCEEKQEIRACVLAWEDALTGVGAAYLRLAPLPHARVDPRAVDFTFFGQETEVAKGRGRGLIVHKTDYPWVELPYAGGRMGRTKALQDYQRSLRPYVSGRDCVFLSNTWGDRNRDVRINEKFLLGEVDAAADLGVEVVQIDDGWQSGKSMNSAFANGKGAWNGYWSVSPDFWKPDPVRFPTGLKFIADCARRKGVRLGLWFGPDSTDDAVNWERDARCLLAFHCKDGIDYFKLDSMKTSGMIAYQRQKKLFDMLIRESNGKIVVDMDVTAEKRPGYFGLMTAGPLFVENRYTDWGTYWPHQTLRTLWSLCEVVDPIRLRMEVLNPRRNVEKYGANPLAPAAYPEETLFAIVMAASPLGWFEVQNLSPSTVAAWRPLVAAWKQERDGMSECNVIPVGAKPDGLSWTGFVFVPRRASAKGYALLFRELSQDSDFQIDFTHYVPSLSEVTVLYGSGKANKLGVSSVRPLGFVWLGLRVAVPDGV